MLILSILSYLVTFNACYGSENHHCDNKPRNKEVYARLKEDIALIRNVCGDLCDTSEEAKYQEATGKYYKQLRKDFSCQKLWSTPQIDASSGFCYAPTTLPKWLAPEYSYAGRVLFKSKYFDESQPDYDLEGRFGHLWTKDAIEKTIGYHRSGYLRGNYGKEAVDAIERNIRGHMDVEGKHILVIGSQTPWVEVVLLSNGVGHITTMDYNPLRTDHPNITLISTQDFANLVNEGRAPYFDGMITFSSLEHSGLGRYGDQLNPWGDLIAMARSWCVLKPGARALIGLPTAKDTICFNANKFYGPIQYAHLFANWIQVHSDVDPKVFDYVDCDKFEYQPIHIVEKPNKP